MFKSLPHTFKSYGLPADVRTLLLLRKSMDKGLVHTLGDIFLVLKAIVVKDPEMVGPFTQAYYDYFLSVDIQPGERLDHAIERSKAFQEWKDIFLEEDISRKEMNMEELISRFLDEVHLTTHDIQQIIDGKDILAKDDPDMEDNPTGARADGERILDKAADYRGIDLEELLRRMERVAKQQKDFHEGGSHWLGQGGISPYGNGGAAKGGIRVGGQGGGKMARAVFDDPRYFPVDMDERLRDDNIDAALSSLKGVFEESAQKELDVPNTIKTGLERGGLFIPEERDIINEKMQIILIIDNGGYSMDPYIKAVNELFKKMKTRFAHDLKTFYFHNTIYDVVYTNETRSKWMTIDRFLAHDPNYRVFIVGDAAMAPYELSHQSLNNWIAIRDKFKKAAWLNPDRQAYWHHTRTTVILGEIFSMFPLTPRGIEEAVLGMNKKKDKRG